MHALAQRHSYFAERGARASDHGLLEPYGLIVGKRRAQDIFDRGMRGNERFHIRSEEAQQFASHLMHFFCRLNQDGGMVTQIHYGALRSANQYLAEQWGSDVGGDVALSEVTVVENLKPLLCEFFDGRSDNQAPLVLYSMNQLHFHANVMLERAFPLVHTGFPWWQNDTPHLIEDYLLHLGGASILASTAGPVCDGRKILSEGGRFEVFDRVICRAIGRLMNDGQMSRNGGRETVKNVMYRNQLRIFRLSCP
jgi:glucuronate isomerase